MVWDIFVEIRLPLPREMANDEVPQVLLYVRLSFSVALCIEGPHEAQDVDHPAPKQEGELVMGFRRPA